MVIFLFHLICLTRLQLGKGSTAMNLAWFVIDELISAMWACTCGHIQLHPDQSYRCMSSTVPIEADRARKATSTVLHTKNNAATL